MKRRIPFLALIAALSLVLFACGSEEKDPDVITNANTPVVTVGPSEAKTTEESTEASTAEETTVETTEESTEAEPSTEEVTEAPTEAPTQAPTEAPTQAPTQEPTSEEEQSSEAVTVSEVHPETPTNPTPVPASGKGAAIAETAGKLIGKTFEFGATGPESFDNSGLVYYCCKENGVTIPRKTSEFATTGAAVGKDALQPGDIVLFSLDGSGSADFAGIYTSNGNFISCNSETTPTGTHALTGFWAEHCIGGRRVG